MSQSHMGQEPWNKGTGGCKRGHDPEFYVCSPSGIMMCMACKRENGAKYRNENRDRIQRKSRLARYGISEAEFKRLWVKQGGACAICGKLFADEEYHIDHDHESGEVRGLLCAACNTAIGLFKDSAAVLDNAIKYLNQHDA